MPPHDTTNCLPGNTDHVVQPVVAPSPAAVNRVRMRQPQRTHDLAVDSCHDDHERKLYGKCLRSIDVRDDVVYIHAVDPPVERES